MGFGRQPLQTLQIIEGFEVLKDEKIICSVDAHIGTLPKDFALKDYL
jgi:hypothetical protein